MDPFLTIAASAFIGAATALVTGAVRSRLARETHASNKVFELRLEAISRVWMSLVLQVRLLFDITGLDTTSQSELIDLTMKARNASLEAERALMESQVLLDASVVASAQAVHLSLSHVTMKSIDSLAQGQPVPYIDKFGREVFVPRVEALTRAVNKTLAASTHRIAFHPGPSSSLSSAY